MKPLYILTANFLSNLYADDQGLVSHFADLGIEVKPLVWDTAENLSGKNVLIRTVWDYHKSIDQFLDLLLFIEKQGGKVVNRFEIVHWNYNKTYLLELGKSGIEIVPTHVYDKFTIDDLISSLNSFNTDLVVKPTVSASGHDTYLLTQEEIKQGRINVDSLLGRQVMAQPFMKSIKEIGEFSFMFFGGKFSHSVLKSPAQNEFRVQKEHGGRESRYFPSEEEIAIVSEYLKKCPFDFPYVRVDVLKESGKLLVMEIEAIEPELFFRFSDDGETKYCKAIAREFGY